MHEHHTNLMRMLTKFREINQELIASITAEKKIHEMKCECDICKKWRRWYNKIDKAITDYDVNLINYSGAE